MGEDNEQAKGLDSKDGNSTEPSTASVASRHDEVGFNNKLGFAIAASALGSAFQHGYNTGVLNNPQGVLELWIQEVLLERNGTSPTENTISTAALLEGNPPISAKTTITTIWAVVVSIFCIGGMVGGAITGLVADRFGRKRGLLLNNIFVLLAVICEVTAKYCGSIELLVLGRFLIGVNSGLNAGIAPMYLNEISPLNLRGAIGTVYQLVITISILIAQILGLKTILGSADLWPVLLGITIVPAVFQLATLPFCPESPKYLLLTKGKEQEAQQSLSWLRCSLAVHEEMDSIRAEYDAIKLVPKVTVRDLFSNAALRIPLTVVLTVMVAQQFSGINAVMFFSFDIFKLANLSSENATYATMGIGAINVIMTIVSLVLVEKAGRKTLLMVGFAGMAIVTLLLTIGLCFTETSNAARFFCIILVAIFVIMFATGPGSIPWFLVSELFNQSARPKATSLAVCVNWGANFIVGLTFLPIKEAIQQYVFIIFVVLQSLFLLFIWKKVPETKNKTMEEISALFRQQSYD